MKHFLRNSLLVILLLLPSFAYDETWNVGEAIVEPTWLQKLVSTYTDPVGKAIGEVFTPIILPVANVFTNISNHWEWDMTMIRLLFTLILIIGLQFLMIKLWVIILKSLIRLFTIYKILTAPKSDLADLLELVSKGKREVSESVRRKIESGKGSIGTIAKIFTLLS